jgi:hypothetical protein
MEREENKKPFPSLPTVLGNPAKNAGLPHSHRTATTTMLLGQFYFASLRDNLALREHELREYRKLL